MGCKKAETPTTQEEMSQPISIQVSSITIGIVRNVFHYCLFHPQPEAEVAIFYHNSAPSATAGGICYNEGQWEVVRTGKSIVLYSRATF